MKLKIRFIAIIFLFHIAHVEAQGTLVYDQESTTQNAIGSKAVYIQLNEPLGQSFTPTLSSIAFVQLFLNDTVDGGDGATVYIDLQSDSIAGTILASTDPVSIPKPVFADYVTFFFPTPIAVTPGTTYFLQVEGQSGDILATADANYGYSGGTAFFSGVAQPNDDLWFREGIVVPEPSPSWLLLLGGGILFYARRKFIP